MRGWNEAEAKVELEVSYGWSKWAWWSNELNVKQVSFAVHTSNPKAKLLSSLFRRQAHVLQWIVYELYQGL